MKRAFTLVEVLIVVPLMLILTLVGGQLLMTARDELQGVALQSDLRQEMRRAAARIYAQARGGYRLDADNRGLTTRAGQHVRWEGRALTVGRQPLLSQPVVLFLATRQAGELVLTLEAEGPRRWHGPPVHQRMVFQGGPQ